MLCNVKFIADKTLGKLSNKYIWTTYTLLKVNGSDTTRTFLGRNVNQKLQFLHFLETWVCASGSKKCLFFRKFGGLCVLVTPVLRLTLLPYYWRITDLEEIRGSHFYTLDLLQWSHCYVLGNPGTSLHLGRVPGPILHFRVEIVLLKSISAKFHRIQ